ncbi:hypothetical protein ACE6H2_003820 [Prunus campanulata]
MLTTKFLKIKNSEKIPKILDFLYINTWPYSLLPTPKLYTNSSPHISCEWWLPLYRHDNGWKTNKKIARAGTIHMNSNNPCLLLPFAMANGWKCYFNIMLLVLVMVGILFVWRVYM